jgi:hypothetical protein
MPTERLLSIVESNETSTHLVASSRVAFDVTARSRMGLPYLASPVCRKIVSVPASMKVPSA